MKPSLLKSSFSCAAVLLAVATLATEAVTLPKQFKDITITTGLKRAVAMTFMPDGRLLVIEQVGRVRLIVNDKLVKRTLLDISGEVLSQMEQGLLGIALDPGYPTRPYLYLYYTNRSPNRNYLVRYTLTGDIAVPDSMNLFVDKKSRVFLLTDIPNKRPFHNGGAVRPGGDNTLYLSLGDDSESAPLRIEKVFRE